MKILVKICGNRSADSVRAAVDAGADEIGFVMVPSPRMVPPDEAEELARFVPTGVKTVAVFRKIP